MALREVFLQAHTRLASTVPVFCYIFDKSFEHYSEGIYFLNAKQFSVFEKK